MADVDITYSRVEEMIALLQRRRRAIGEILDRMRQHVDDLVESGFKTDRASRSFQEHYEALSTALAARSELLDHAAEQLGAAQDAYQDADALAAKRFAK